MSVTDKVLGAIDGIAEDYREWSVGITSVPEGYREVLGSPQEWHCWDVQAEHIAHFIAAYLVASGMKNKSDHGEDSGRYVCVFRSPACQ